MGPDGSGKSTLIAKIIEKFKLTFRSNKRKDLKCFYRPHILPNIAHIFKKKSTKKKNLI